MSAMPAGLVYTIALSEQLEGREGKGREGERERRTEV